MHMRGHGEHGARRSWLRAGLAAVIVAGLVVAVALGVSPWILAIGAMALMHLFMHMPGGHRHGGGHDGQTTRHRGC